MVLGNKIGHIAYMILLGLLTGTILITFLAEFCELLSLIGIISNRIHLFVNSEIGFVLLWLLFILITIFIIRKKNNRWLIHRVILLLISCILLVVFLCIDSAMNNYLYERLLYLFGGDQFIGSSREKYALPILLGVIYPIIYLLCFILYITMKGLFKCRKRENRYKSLPLILALIIENLHFYFSKIT